MSKAIKVGDKVRFVDRKAHKQTPEYYPSVGTIGTVVMDECNPKDWKIQWPKGTTSGDDRWYCGEKSIELFDGKIEKDEMTNEEIWEMLRPKMEKNALTTKNIHAGLFGPIYTYNEKDVHNAVALAYKVGYLRAIKGRPFKFGEKKKKSGHWEPVDPNNLPKEGKRVRYSRESEEYAKEPSMINVGDIGVFSYGNLGVPGIQFDDDRFWDWISFSNEIDCLDMWVEDDE